ncbi:MAG: RNA chaperone Hfq [candidate division WS1 bacterium]|nr:RNA chaperone Hfq [candidate division WS1 bacterium]
MSKPRNSLQDRYLQTMKDEGTVMRIVMVNGKQLSGKLADYDTFTVLVDISGVEVMVYKSAIAVLGPATDSS